MELMVRRRCSPWSVRVTHGVRLLLTPMVVGVMVTSLIAGQVTTRTGRYKALPILGAPG